MQEFNGVLISTAFHDGREAGEPIKGPFPINAIHSLCELKNYSSRAL